MKSPLEERPEVLEKIGLFIVLFNTIDLYLSKEFNFLIRRSAETQQALNFLETQDFLKKITLLKVVLGEALFKKILKVNDFRIFIAHGMYGMDSSGEITLIKQKRDSSEYEDRLLMSEIITNIEKEREILKLLHALVLKRLPNITSSPNSSVSPRSYQ